MELSLICNAKMVGWFDVEKSKFPKFKGTIKLHPELFEEEFDPDDYEVEELKDKLEEQELKLFVELSMRRATEKAEGKTTNLGMIDLKLAKLQHFAQRDSWALTFGYAMPMPILPIKFKGGTKVMGEIEPDFVAKLLGDLQLVVKRLGGGSKMERAMAFEQADVLNDTLAVFLDGLLGVG